MPQHPTIRVSLHVLSVGCALSIFLADLLLPVGVAVSLPYIAVVWLAARSSWRGSAALAALGVEGGQAAFVGDRPDKDVVGARGAGLLAVRVRTGEYRGVRDQAPPWRTVQSVTEAVEALEPLLPLPQSGLSVL